jgi:hypothetical protein
MSNRSSTCAVLVALATAMTMMVSVAQAADDSKYPNLQGQWRRFIVPGVGGQGAFDQTKPWGAPQQAPLTPEYRAIFEASLADQAAGGHGGDPGFSCFAYGMPRMMNVYSPMEILVTPETTHILIYNLDHGRRIFTDGRNWPEDAEASFQGYSIGKWLDTDGDGRYDTLEVETRGPFKGPRTYDASGLPLHHDNQSVFKERMFLDKDDPNVMHNLTTVFDHALTHPWTVDRRYVRSKEPQPTWSENTCTENNHHISIADDNYFLSADGLLMPARKDQAPPDLRYFKPKRK